LKTARADRSASASEPRFKLRSPRPAPAPVVQPPQIELGDPIRPLPFSSAAAMDQLSPRSWPDQLREILGKVGLMTLINALAVLAYVFLFRKHHH